MCAHPSSQSVSTLTLNFSVEPCQEQRTDDERLESKLLVSPQIGSCRDALYNFLDNYDHPVDMAVQGILQANLPGDMTR